jgi:hypothetical protein
MKVAAAILVALLGAAQAAQAEVKAWPESPHAGQEFVLQFNGNGCGPFTNARAEVAGSIITVAFEDAGVCFGLQPPGATFVSVALRAPVAAGTYEVRQRDEYRGQVLLNQSVGQVTVGPAAFPTRPTQSLNGLWFDPQAPGQGLSITEGDSGQLFLVWFTYSAVSNDGVRAPTAWYMASSTQWITNTSASGPYYSSTGPRDGTAFNPALVRHFPLGLATVTLISPNNVIFEVEGNNGIGTFRSTLNLQKFGF